jgi:glycerophosphoryl diester phosphodiesterase
VPNPVIIAHRGASLEAPENTLAAFQRAMALKADGIELDVQITSDGIAVVFHDDSLRRLTGKAGRLTAKTWAELQTLRVLGSDQGIPRLKDILVQTRGRIVVQIELKRGVRVAPVLVAIRQARAASWVILASFEADLVREAAELAPRIPRMLISEGRRSSAAILRQLAECKAVGISINCRAVRRPEFIKYFQDMGFTVWCWTVNDKRTAKRLIAWGADGLLGDNPALLTGLI